MVMLPADGQQVGGPPANLWQALVSVAGDNDLLQHHEAMISQAGLIIEEKMPQIMQLAQAVATENQETWEYRLA